jgi:hypothetical protein
MKRTNHNHYRGFYLFLVLFCPQAWGQSEVGKVVSLTGKVMARIEAKGQSSRKIPKVRFLKPADPVFREDVINTDSNGSVKILFQDQSIMDLGQSSLFKVEEFENKPNPEERKVEMSLGYGRIRAAINQKIGTLGKFKIKTRAATMGVRGTEFYVMSEIEDSPAGKGSEGTSGTDQSLKTQVVVTEGKVEVSAPKGSEPSAGFAKPVEVLPGEKFTASLDLVEDKDSGRAPASVASAVEKVAPEEMKTVVDQGKLKDTTFTQSIQIEAPTNSSSDSKGSPAIAFAGSETMSIIKESILSKPEVQSPAPPVGGFAVPGGPLAQPNSNGNFLPGFITTPLVRLNVIIK